MEEVQLTISDVRYAAALRDKLESTGARAVSCVDAPDANRDGVIVIDSDALDSLPFPLLNPERVVLITRNDPRYLSHAWNAGIRSVVFSEDSLSTAVLAIMAAGLRVAKPREDRGNLQTREPARRRASSRSGRCHKGLKPAATAADSPGSAPASKAGESRS